MTINQQITAFLERFREMLTHWHPEVEAKGRRGRVVWWTVRQGDWLRPCWISVSEYQNGYRIRNNFCWPNVPKRAWPGRLTEVGGCARFELTFHNSELTDDLYELLFSCCSVPDFSFESPLFSESGKVPSYAWTIKADALLR